MKTKFWKAAVCFSLLCLLAFSMTGCDNLNYREAVQLYNAGAYAEAAEMFSALEGYEDSDRLQTRCYYRIALQSMESGNYDTALEQFQDLGNYEDSPARVTECNYQLAMAAFDSGDLDTAEAHFLATPGYRKTPEFLRRINWQNLFDTLAENNPGEVESALTLEQDGRTVQVIARSADMQEIIFSVSAVKDMGYVFTDSFLLRLTRDSLQATFSAESSFTMDFKGEQIGSRQTGKGTLDISTCTGKAPLILDSFGITVTDNQGQSTTSTDPADCLMAEAMAENLAVVLDTVPGMLADAGIPQTLADIGFSAIA